MKNEGEGANIQHSIQHSRTGKWRMVKHQTRNTDPKDRPPPVSGPSQSRQRPGLRPVLCHLSPRSAAASQRSDSVPTQKVPIVFDRLTHNKIHFTNISRGAFRFNQSHRQQPRNAMASVLGSSLANLAVHTWSRAVCINGCKVHGRSGWHGYFRDALARPPFRPPLRAEAWASFFPRPEPLFLPPWLLLFTVAQARRLASPLPIPRCS